MAKELDNKKAIKEFESFMKRERERIMKKFPGEEGERMIRDFFVKKMPKQKKPMGKKIRVQKPRMLAHKGGTAMPMKKKSKMMARGGMKKSKMMARGGMKKKSKMMARGGMKKSKMYARGGAARRR